jgi:hypothetical protein
MDRYTKGFVLASLVYLVAASALGIWMGGGDAPDWAWFAHVHFNLLGFMAMMIYGVGYFILPRFNARPLKWPGWVTLHFYVANAGLIGMVATYPERPSAGFIIFSLFSVFSAAMFAVNLGVTILGPAEEELDEEGEEAVEEAPPAITPESRIGEIITLWPETADLLVEKGFTPLADPAHCEKVKRLPVTLAMGCANHGIDLEMMVELLNRTVSAAGTGTAPPARKKIGPKQIIGDVLEAHPATEKIFKKYYGEACFSCPGQATESIRQSAMMHNVDEKQLLRELKEVTGTG